MDKKVMYIEYKGDQIVGPAHIGQVKLSKTGATLYYKGKEFKRISGGSGKANYYDVESGEDYWISGCHKDGKDALYSTVVEIDDDIREKYWIEIRNKPEKVKVKKIKITGKYKK